MELIIAVLTSDQTATVAVVVWVGLMLLVFLAAPAAWRRYAADPAYEPRHGQPVGWREPVAVVATTVMDLAVIAAAVAAVAWSAYVESESWRVA